MNGSVKRQAVKIQNCFPAIPAGFQKDKVLSSKVVE
jgi:hypothetical protein